MTLKKLMVVLLVFVMLLSGCGEKVSEVGVTASPTADATATATATATAKPTATAIPVPTPRPTPIISKPEVETANVLPENVSSFNKVSSFEETGWTMFSGAEATLEEDDDGGKCIRFTVPYAWSSVMLDISKYIKQSGTYTITFKYKIEAEDDIEHPFNTVIRSENVSPLIPNTNEGLVFMDVGYAEEGIADDWCEFETEIDVSDEAVGKGAPWNFGVHLIKEGITAISIDDVCVGISKYVYKDVAQAVTGGETWVANEAVFISSKDYGRPFYEVEMDLILTNGSVTYTIPCFWDGGSVWRARFMCPTEGNWSYKTVCSDKSNAGLHNQTSSFKITKYSGDLDIYKHGFVKTVENTKYFVYDDGTPFFYLGDTHWNLSGEPLSNVMTVVDKRVEQNYSVIQSEPLGADFEFADGIGENDILGLRVNDQKFKYIADSGLVHANASFFFPSSMQIFINNNGGFSKKEVGTFTNSKGTAKMYDLSDEAKAALERISRYWVARYAAYPVMWTLGQEVDNDFYYDFDREWSYINNPYKLVAEYISKHDPYKSPLSAHQENTGGTDASRSAFRDVESHNWYAVQWSPSLTGGSNQTAPKDYWLNGQGKPAINYESRYCYLWTKNFGARAQGWISYLNGMYGYGYGAQDTWSYLNTYNEDETSNDGVDTITSADKKAATWYHSLEYSSSYQVGYMRTFFEEKVGDWYNLIPKFEDAMYFMRSAGAFASVAANGDNSKIVAYFYNFSDETIGEKPNASVENGTKTGMFAKLIPNATYNYMWFNPVTGEVEFEGTFTAAADGTWQVGEKKTCDMVLYIYK